MACKDKCCCAVKRRPAKKRKATVGKVSATQLLAQSIASLVLPRKAEETFLYGNSPLGEAQRYEKPVEPTKLKIADTVSIGVGTAPTMTKSMGVGTEPIMTKSIAIGTDDIGVNSMVASPITDTSRKATKERKSYSSMIETPSAPSITSDTTSSKYFTGTLLERTPMGAVSNMTLSLPDKQFNVVEMSALPKRDNRTTFNTQRFNPNTLSRPDTTHLTNAGLGRKIPGFKGVVGEVEIRSPQGAGDFFSTAGNRNRLII
jgi:hypothetical protein